MSQLGAPFLQNNRRPVADNKSEVPTMPQLLERARLNGAQSGGDRAVRILAKSLYRQLRESGYEHRDILSLSTELVGLITSDLRPSDESDV
jgi:hypothetical protein